jgi:hypothetical protein
MTLTSTPAAQSKTPLTLQVEWLAWRGLKTGYFFPEELDFGDYLDPGHPLYAPKLAVAVLAWRATGNEWRLSRRLVAAGVNGASKRRFPHKAAGKL